MYHLNSDQLLALMNSKNFIRNAKPTRIVDCLKGLQKGREIKIFKDRPEIISAIQFLTDDKMLLNLPESYVTSLAHAVSKMKIDDEVIWFKLAAHLSKRHDQFNLRNLTTFVYAFTNISKLKPVILNFDDLFKKLELQLIKKFD